MKIYVPAKACTGMFIVTLFIVVKKWKKSNEEIITLNYFSKSLYTLFENNKIAWKDLFSQMFILIRKAVIVKIIWY